MGAIAFVVQYAMSRSVGLVEAFALMSIDGGKRGRRG